MSDRSRSRPDLRPLRGRALMLVALAAMLLALTATAAGAAPFALVGNSLDDTLTIIDVAAPAPPIATIALSGMPSGIATNPVRREGYVAILNLDGAATLAVISTNVFLQTAEIPLSVIDATGVAVNAAGTRAYVTGGFSDNLVSVVDLDLRAEIATIAVSPPATPAGPVGVAAHPTLARLYVANSNAGTISVVNTSTNAVIATITLGPCPGGCAPQELAVSPNGALLFVTDPFADAVWVINTATNAVVRAVPLGFLALPEGIAVHPDGSKVYVTHLDIDGNGRLSVISTGTTNPILGDVGVGANPIGVAVDPAGTSAYVIDNGDDTVTVASTADLTSQIIVPVGGAPSTFGRFITPALAPVGPAITSFTPAAGPVGTIVSIVGTNLDGATDVTFTGPVTVTPTAVTATLLRATVPAGALSGPVSVTNAAGTGTSTAAFKVLPRITGFTPGSAVAGSATAIVVSGNNLRAAAGEPVVKIGTFTVPAGSVLSSGLTQLSFTIPLGAVTGKIGVTTADGTVTSATDLVVVQPPKVTGITPATGPVGALITVAGTGLAGATAVTFTGPVTVTPTAVTATSLRATVPVGALTGPVSVTNAAGTGVSTAVFKVQPRITGFTPASAVAGSDTVIIVSGNNLRALTGEPVVKIGTLTVPAGRVVSSTPSELQFTIPLGAVSNTIGVTTIDGTGTSSTTLVVIQPPKVTGLTPATAPVGGLVTIAGANLLGVTDVTFTGPVTVTPTAVTATSVKAIVPPGALTGVIRVTNPFGTGTSTAIFKVKPSITGFTPASAVGGSATVIVVSGNNLRAAVGEPVVKIGTFTVPAGSVLSSGLTELRLTIPLGAVTGKISVTTVDGLATSATSLAVIQPPKVTGLKPTAAPVGALIIVAGANLLGTTAVTFTGPVTVTPTAVTATSLKALVPEGARTGQVSVTNPAGTGVSTGLFKIVPRIAGFDPASAVAGSDTAIVVSGSNLRAATGEPVVKIGTLTVPAARVLSSTPTELRFRIPLGAVSSRISIATVDGTGTSANTLGVIQPPKVTKLTPAAGPVGAVLTIAGTNLLGVTGVTFTGPITVTPTAVTATSVKAVVPAGALTGMVSVTNPVGTGTSTAVFKVQPRITDFTPAAGLAGDSVTVTGFNLRMGAPLPTAKIGTVAAVVTDATATSVTLTVPATAVTGKISVTTVDGTGISVATFRVIKPPTLSSVTPATGTEGTLVTITGTNVLDLTDVAFNGTSAGAPTVVSATSVRITVPAGATTGKITITNRAGSAQSAGTFTVTAPAATSSTGRRAVETMRSMEER